MRGFFKTLGFGLLILVTSGCAPKPELPVYGAVPEFSLTDRSTRPVTRADLEGKVWIADFIFTSCRDTCPAMTTTIRKLQDQLPAEIQFVSFSVDPGRDSPSVLSEYANRNGADPNRWFFLTGDQGAVHKLSKEGFKLAVADAAGSTTEAETITHSTRFALIDRKGRIRGYYGLEDADAMPRLLADARKLL